MTVSNFIAIGLCCEVVQFPTLLFRLKSFSCDFPKESGNLSFQLYCSCTATCERTIKSKTDEILRVAFGDVSEAECRCVRNQLEEYCGQETQGMVWITEALRQLI